MVWRVAKWLGLSLVVVLALLALFLLAVRKPGGDSLAVLPQAAGPATEVSQEASREDGRLIRHHTIQDPALGTIGLVVSLPDPLPQRPLPIVVVLGGLGPGHRTLRHLPPPGNNVVVAYDWPIPRKLPKRIDLLWRGPELYDRVFTVPGQIAAAVAWVADQPWGQRDRISILGFSLGALAAPAAQRLLQVQGLSVGWTVLAYGGADIGSLLQHHPKAGPDWLRPLVGWLGDWLFGALDPAEHLPHLRGRFLLIGGTDDGLVPEKAARLMQELAPDPKTIVRLSGQHIGVGKDRQALIDEILGVTEDWLTGQGAVNPR